MPSIAHKRSRMTEDKAPNSSKHHVGIEIEFACPYNRLHVIYAFIQAGLDAYVTVKDDGSIDGSEFCTGECRFGENCDCCNCETAEQREENGCECDCACRCGTHELCVLIRQDRLHAIMRRICFVLNHKLKARVNKSCGLHVHLDMRNRDARRAFYNLVRSQELLFKMVPPSRREVDYCKKVNTDKLEEYSRLVGDRYFAVNAESLREHLTLEVRLHSGTTDYEKITNWVELLIKIAEAPYMHNQYVQNTTSLGKAVKIRKGLMKYVSGRLDKFSGTKREKLDYEDAA